MLLVLIVSSFNTIDTEGTDRAGEHFQLNLGSLWGLIDLFLPVFSEWLDSLKSPALDVEGCGDVSLRDSGG